MMPILSKVNKRTIIRRHLLNESSPFNIPKHYLFSSFEKQKKTPISLDLFPSAIIAQQYKNNHRNKSVLSTSTNPDIKKSVFISQSNDIYTNLALEDWLYRHFDFSFNHVLLLWVNDPCVVIGRHQNPFMEANILDSDGVKVARRNSGGGTVYHDRGNLNCTFFTPRERYNRKYNLNILTRAVFREWAIKSEINERDDVCVNGRKFSGTAAKLGYPNAYHHCTLLANTDKLILENCLNKEKVNYTSKSTVSVRSAIRNLYELNRSVNITQLISAVGYEYLRTFATELEDGGHQQTMRQRGFQLINPTEKWFPGITDLRTEFSSWEWIYGKTPKFSVEKELFVKYNDKQLKIVLNVAVEKGLINHVTITMPNEERLPVISSLRNEHYNEWNLKKIIKAVKLVSTDSITEAINSH